MNERIKWIDTTKGIAIILVVIGHMIPRNKGIGLWIYSFHMPLFFIISGMLLFYNPRWESQTLSEIIAIKIKSLLYPYMMLSLFSLVIVYILNGKASFIKELINTILFEGILTLWFLPALFIGEVIFIAITKKLGKTKGVWIIFFCFMIITELFQLIERSFYQGIIMGYMLTAINVVNRSVIGGIFIFIGYHIADYFDKHSIERNVNIFFAIIGLLITIITCRWNYVDLRESIIGNPILFYANAISGTGFLLIISKYLISENKLLMFFGKNSLVIFGTHLNFKILPLAYKLIGTESSRKVITFLMVLMIESVMILFINKYFKWVFNYHYFKAIVKRKKVEIQ